MTNACFEILMSPLLPVTETMRIYLSIISISVALVTLLLIRSNFSVNKKMIFVYVHITSLIFPVVLFTAQTTCGYLCFSCYSNPVSLTLLALPTTVIASTIVSLFAVPIILTKINGRKLEVEWIDRFNSKYSGHLKIKKPRIYVIDKSKPVAFSFKTFKSAVFLSVGMLEMFSRKEIEAVLLHELMHIKRNSSMLKFSNSMLKVFSPLYNLAAFGSRYSKEEAIADSFVAKIQNTRRHLLSAKMKLREFY